MERELWESLCRLMRMVYKLRGPARYGDDVIVAVFWWSVVHERPVSWSCERENWPPDLQCWPLPSQPTMSRRLRSPSVELLVHEVEQLLVALTGAARCWVWMIDGKPLTVGGASKDLDAAWGRAAGGIQKGYKLHTVWGDGPLPIAWSLTPLNRNEQVVARKLLDDLPSGGYVLGDKQYDGNKLYDAAAESGCQLLAAPKRKGGLGHRRHSPYRLRSRELLATPFGKTLYRQRIAIERQFAWLTSFVGGLGPLPFWVRRFNRVRMWLQSKILANAVRRILIHPELAVE